MAQVSAVDRVAAVFRSIELGSLRAAERETGHDRHHIAKWKHWLETTGSAQTPDREEKDTEVAQEIKTFIVNNLRGKEEKGFLKSGKSLREVQLLLRQQKHISLSTETVRQAALAEGLRPFRRQHKMKVKPEHKKQRLAFAQWAAQQHQLWERVIFTDEHIFRANKPKNRAQDYQWAFKEEASKVGYRELEAFGPQLHVWAGVWQGGKTQLHFLEHNLTAKYYIEILQNKLLPILNRAKRQHLPEPLLLQDKASSHTAQKTTDWLEEKNVAVLENWPAKGADMNIIENIWAILDATIAEEELDTQAQLQAAVQKAWDELDMKMVNRMVQGMTNRIQLVVNGDGAVIRK